MKPFPEAVQKAFPCAPGRVPDRPWWRYAVWPCQTRLIPELEAGSNKQYRAEDADDAAEADANYPIPHPGYRAGQIWADENGNSILVLFRSETSILTVKTMPMWGPWFTGYSGSGDDFLLDYPYLISDPACPHLAPWSPSQPLTQE